MLDPNCKRSNRLPGADQPLYRPFCRRQQFSTDNEGGNGPVCCLAAHRLRAANYTGSCRKWKPFISGNPGKIHRVFLRAAKSGTCPDFAHAESNICGPDSRRAGYDPRKPLNKSEFLQTLFRHPPCGGTHAVQPTRQASRAWSHPCPGAADARSPPSLKSRRSRRPECPRLLAAGGKCRIPIPAAGHSVPSMRQVVHRPAATSA